MYRYLAFKKALLKIKLVSRRKTAKMGLVKILINSLKQTAPIAAEIH